MKDMKKKFEEMSDDEKQKVADEIAQLPQDEYEGNTNVSRFADDEELTKKIDEMSPKQIFESNVAANYRSTHLLEQLIPKMSKKNLKKLLLAVLKLPEENSDLQFGGKQEDKKVAEYAFIQAQVASNARTYIISVDAAARAKAAKQQKKDNQGEDNE